jgi:hypothetical protein
MSRASSTLRAFSRPRTRRLLASLGILWTLTLAGCLQGPMEEPEHVTPAHRPADYPAAVVRLDVLIQEIESDSARDTATIDVFAEWTDLIRWLPDMAGDSDLKEPDWNRVNEATRQLEQIGRAWEKLDGDSRRSAFRSSIKAIRECWVILDEVARERAVVFRPPQEQQPFAQEQPTKDASATDSGEMP